MEKKIVNIEGEEYHYYKSLDSVCGTVGGCPGDCDYCLQDDDNRPELIKHIKSEAVKEYVENAELAEIENDIIAKNEIERLEKENTDLENRNKALKSEIKGMKKDKEIEALKAKNVALKANVKNLEKQNSGLLKIYNDRIDELIIIESNYNKVVTNYNELVKKHEKLETKLKNAIIPRKVRVRDNDQRPWIETYFLKHSGCNKFVIVVAPFEVEDYEKGLEFGCAGYYEMIEGWDDEEKTI